MATEPKPSEEGKTPERDPVELDDTDSMGDPFGEPKEGNPQAMPDEVERGWERTDPTKGEAPSG